MVSLDAIYGLMKNILTLLIFLMSFSISPLFSQTSGNIGISFKKLWMDYQTPNGGKFANFKDYHSGFEVALHKDLTDNLRLSVPFKLGVVNNDSIVEGRDYFRKMVYGLDAQLNYEFGMKGVIEPYILAGIGGVMENNYDRLGLEEAFNVQIPIGAGFKTRLFEKAYFNYQLEYRISLDDDRNNLHHGIGFLYMFGDKMEVKKPEEPKVKDEDGDGVSDLLDLCPQVAGLPEFNGCPDNDGDGIPDYLDLCPDQAGSKELRGCPDSDGDGLPDSEDDCPNEAGPAANKGCPDRDADKDGVMDNVDNCPNIPGPASNKGCPVASNDRDNDGVADNVDRCPNKPGRIEWDGCPDSDGDSVPDHRDLCPSSPGPAVYSGCPDTDGDGIHDGRDACPSRKGTVALNGCPEIKKADRETLDIAMRAVQFDLGKATLKAESYDVLGQIVSILQRYPDYSLSIEGHTDNTGSASNNQVLSERRAKSCYDFLINRGISSRRLSYAGYGESRPVANNNSLRGRTLNRRVEFKMVAPGIGN